MTRLDVLLVNKGIVKSRSNASVEIKSGNVYVNGKKVCKPSYDVDLNDDIKLEGSSIKYVSRAGLKLEKAINEFCIDLNDKVLLDIGSSTGGFTDCALQNNIREVIDVDVGSNQLDDKIRSDKKVHVFENTDIRTFNNELLNIVDIISIDVSFISVEKILNKISEIKSAREVICLIKPQFECGKFIADKYKGVIKDKSVHISVINNLINKFNSINYGLKGVTYSPIKGGSGNIEYLAYFVRDFNNSSVNVSSLVDSAFNRLS